MIGLAILAIAGPVAAEPAPALDDFYERTRQRQDGFDTCIGYGDGHWLATLVVGAETAARLGVELGVRGDGPDVAGPQ